MTRLLGRRQVVVGGLFAAASLASFGLEPRQRVPGMRRNVLDAWMPDVVGRYAAAQSSAIVLPPSDDLESRLYDNLVSRIYIGPDGPPIMLLIAYSSTQDGMLQVHRPEFCYEAAGFELTPTTRVDLSDRSGRSFGGNAFAGTSPDRLEQVIYWTRIGSAFPQSWTQQRLAVMDENLHGRIPDGLLGRVSTTVEEGPLAIGALQQFVEALSRASSSRLNRLLFGHG